MFDLRNRNQYPIQIREEFEHVISQIGSFLEQIFDADGNFIQPSQVSPVKFVHYGDISIANGNSTGTSTLPQVVDVSKTVLIHLGETGTGSIVNRITLSNSNTVSAIRTGTSNDLVINYCIIEYN